ncbi:MAG: hypothetical protein KatS3mg009_2813 [Acidimicrobiia bacterium]|nr:MAG: hypothetical protein KatS3mg009_2813 [Acidimicrobiia bacterium]
MLGLDPDEPVPPGAVGRLGFVAWSAPDRSRGWVLRLAIEDPAQRLAWAIDAWDGAGSW